MKVWGLSLRPVDHQRRLLGLILLLAAFLFCGLQSILTLEVKERKSGEILFRERVAPGEQFHFSYTHSVEKTPVEATFAIEEDGGLRTVETRFPSYGPGLPSSGERALSKGGWFVHPGGDCYEKLTFHFSSSNQPLLRLRDREAHLSLKRGDGGSLEFSVKRDSLIVYGLKGLYRMAGGSS